MFTGAEAKFLDEKLAADIAKKQEQIKVGVFVGETREQIEQEIILSMSILNKLQKALPKEKNNDQTRVLVVDDVDSMRQINCHLLKGIGFSVVDYAADGNKAIKMMRQAQENGRQYGLVISDWEMPVMSGLELLKEVRSDDDLWRIPFYLLTSVADKTHVLEAIKAGASGYMVKPISQQILKTKFGCYL